MTEKVHSKSCECFKSELDLFELPPTQVAIEDNTDIEYHPISSLSETSPIEFVISGVGDEYVDLTKTILNIKLKIVKGNEHTSLEATDKVTPVNLLLQSLFSQVDVFLGDKLISSTDNCYAYRAYLETLLNHGQDSKATQLTASGWYMDEGGKFNELDPTEQECNAGLKARNSLAAESKTIDLVGSLHCDIFKQERLILNNVDIRVKLTRNKHSFCLLSPDKDPNFKIFIEHASLFVRKIKVSPSVLLAHSKILPSTSAKYPLTKVECKVFSIPKGNLQANLDNVFIGQLPKRVVLGLVENTAFNGSFKQNPFHFHHFDCNLISLSVDGRSIPSQPYQPDYTNNLYARNFLSLFAVTDRLGCDTGLALNYSEYGQGSTLYAFDLSADNSSNSGYFQLESQGTVRVDMRFKTALPSTVNVIVYAEFQKVLEIDSSRNILMD